MTTATSPDPARGARRHRAGAPLLPPTLAYAVLTVLAVTVPPLAAGVQPWSSDGALSEFFRSHSGAAHASAFLTLGAAIPFAVFVAVATTRLRTLGVDVPGRIIAQVGGTVAATMLALAGLATLAATRSHVADSIVALRVLSGISFAAGGPGFVVFSGLLLAGVSISGLMGGVLHRGVAWGGIAVAVVCEVASASAAFPGLDVLLPIGRFGGLLWMLAVGVTLPATRRELRAGQRSQRARVSA
jgi:hypothetical protein